MAHNTSNNTAHKPLGGAFKNAHIRWASKEDTLRVKLLQPYCKETSVPVFLKEHDFPNLAAQLQKSFVQLDKITCLYKEEAARENAWHNDYLYKGKKQSKNDIIFILEQIDVAYTEMGHLAGSMRDIINTEKHMPTTQFDDKTQTALKMVDAYLWHLKDKHFRAQKGNLAFDKASRRNKSQTSPVYEQSLNLAVCF